MSSSDRLSQLIDYLFARELRDAHYSQLDIMQILQCHERAHLNAMAVVVSLSPEELDRMLSWERGDGR